LKVGSTTSIAVSAVSGDKTYSESSNSTAVVNRTALDVAPGREPVLASGTGALTGYASRVGDPVALVADDGRSFTGDELYATTLACLASSADASADTTTVVAYPTHWQGYTVDALRDAADHHGLTDATYVPEAIASVAWLQRARGVDGDGTVVVYDLGGSALDVALVRTGADSALIGRSVHSEDVSGAQFDHAVLQHVLDSSGADLSTLDPFDPDTVDALAVLRERCAAAKEALSTDTDTVVTVELPGVHTDVRVVRSELEDMIREPLTSSLDVVREALRQGGVDPSDVTRVLLTGGGASIPLVAELISSMLRVPVTAHDDPALTSAAGAAVLAGEIGSAGSELDTIAAAPVAAAAPAVAAPRALRTSLPVSDKKSRHKPPMSRGKRVAIIAGTVAAIALLAAGGLGVGTMLTSNDSPTTDGAVATTTSVAPTTTSVAPVAGAPTSAAPGGTDTAAPGSAPAGGSNSAGSNSAGSNSGGTAQTGTQNTGAPNTGAPNSGGAPAAGTPNTGTTGGNTGGGGTTGGGDTGGGNTGGGNTGGGQTYTPPTFQVPTNIPTNVPNIPIIPGVVNGVTGVAGQVLQAPGAILGGG
jgi:actin-like ATPase involved in cell morphogenesis